MMIYCIRNNISEKMYIGQTQCWEQRRQDHRSYLKRNDHWNIHLQRSWNKYSSDCFDFVILERCNSRKELNSREKYWISKLDTTNKNKGYNMKTGGEQFNHTLEVKEKISNSLKGQTSPRKGYEYTNKEKEEARKLHAKSRGTSVQQLDKNDNAINTYPSIMEAQRQTDAHEYGIRECLKGNRKTSGGYKWRKI